MLAMKLSEQLTQARQEASQRAARPIPMSEVVDGVRELLGKLTPTETAIANLHKEKTCPKHPDPLTLWAVARVYETPLEDLDPAVAAALNNVVEMEAARRRHPRVERSNPGKGARVGARSENTPKASDLLRRENPGKYVMARRVA